MTDLFSPEFVTNPYPAYAELREAGPVHRVRTPFGSDVWLVTRYADAREALADPRLSKDPANAPEWFALLNANDDGPIGRNMLSSDPPDHTRLRKLMMRAFTRRRVEALRPRIQEITDELLEAMAGRAEADLIEAFAYPLPITVICELLGVPVGERDRFRRWTSMLLLPPTPENMPLRNEGLAALSQYVSDMIDSTRANIDPAIDPDEQPDLISGMVSAAEDQDRLSERELHGTIRLLLIAGHETTVNLIGNGMRALLGHPDQLELLRAKPELLPGTIEELLRYDGPVERSTFRFTTQDTEIAGVTVPAGNIVSIALASADRDPDFAGDPDRLDITRKNQGHVAFGHGIHFCLGAPLARLEGQIAIGSLLERFPKIALAVPEEDLSWRLSGGTILRGLEQLPVRLE